MDEKSQVSFICCNGFPLYKIELNFVLENLGFHEGMQLFWKTNILFKIKLLYKNVFVSGFVCSSTNDYIIHIYNTAVNESVDMEHENYFDVSGRRGVNTTLCKNYFFDLAEALGKVHNILIFQINLSSKVLSSNNRICANLWYCFLS